MNKRLFLATSLSLLVLLVWSRFASQMQPAGKNTVASQLIPSDRVVRSPASATGTPAPSSAFVQPASAPIVEDVSVPPSSVFTFVGEKVDAAFDESRGALTEVVFKDYQDHKFVLTRGFLLADNTLSFVREDTLGSIVKFVHTDDNKKITKLFTFSKANYTIDLDITIENLSSAPISINTPLVLGVMDFTGSRLEARYQDVAAVTPEKTLRLNGQKNATWASFKFLGMRDRYFCAIIQPDTEQFSGFVRKLGGPKSKERKSEVGFNLQALAIAPGQQIGHNFRIYIGPQKPELVSQADPEWSKIVHYGAFNFISSLLLRYLDFLHRVVRNWGIAIILLSLTVYMVVFPLTLKQMHSMKDMNALKPKMEELRKLHKDNPQKMNKEVMELYKQHKVNPLGGCLPLFLQMPIFFALYQALMRSVALKGAKFLWIKDLSQPDRLFTLPSSLPVIGNEINILPIVMAVLMLLQQKVSMAATGGTGGEQEKMMMIIFPLMFGFIFYHMPAGLVLYWLINSTLMFLNQSRILKKK